LTHLPQLQPAALPQIGEIEATVAALSAPCNPTWCMARVAALLSPYYDKATPQAVREIEAEDWLEALAEYPQWAIERAVRWWKSADNADRRRRPMEGDIAARCVVEMRGIKAVPAIVRGIASRASTPARPEVILTDAQREERKAALADVAASLRKKAMNTD
jgi:hypothetical protein